MDLDSKKHFSLLSARDIDEICKPLKLLNVHLFNFVRLYKNGARINLCNNAPWLHHYYKSNFHTVGLFEGDPTLYNSGYTLWTTLSGEQIFQDARNYFAIDHGLTIIKQRSIYCDFFYFAGKPEQHYLTSFYLNNIDLMEKFIAYFLAKGSNLISQANKTKIILPLRSKEVIKSELDKSWIGTMKRREFESATTLKSYHIYLDKREVMLSSKEVACLKHLVQGKNSKEIAQALFRSKRTVENHIYNIKNKLGYSLKSQLVDVLLQNDFPLFIKT